MINTIKAFFKKLLYAIYYMPSVVQLVVHTFLGNKRYLVKGVVSLSITVKMSPFRLCSLVHWIICLHMNLYQHMHQIVCGRISVI